MLHLLYALLATARSSLKPQRELALEADREVHFNLDGEPTAEHKLHFSVLPKHLKVAF